MKTKVFLQEKDYFISFSADRVEVSLDAKVLKYTDNGDSEIIDITNATALNLDDHRII